MRASFFGETQRFIVKDCENLILHTVLPAVTISTKIIYLLFLSIECLKFVEKFVETFNIAAMSYLRCRLALAVCGMISKRRRPKRAVWQGNGEKLSSDNLRAFSTYQKHTRVRPGLQAQDMDSDMETHMQW